MGIDMEYDRSTGILGSSVVGVNTAYRNLVGNLTAYGSGPIIVRIGGNSSDSRKGITNVLPFAEFAKAVGSHFILGVNLGAGNVDTAVDQTKSFISQMPPNTLDAIEIGNEPEGFIGAGFRKPPYTSQNYLKDYDEWRAKIFPLLPAGTRLTGPAWAHYPSPADAKAFLAAEHSYLYGLSQHSYASGSAGNSCTSGIPFDILLRPETATYGPTQVKSEVVLAHGYNLPVRLDELGAVSSCAGQDGVSNTFGSALWAIDTMFEYASVGVDGINWYNSNGDLDSAFEFAVGNITDAMKPVSALYLKKVNPLYYGMLFFQVAVGKQAHLLPVSMSTQENVKTWATVDAAGVVRLVVINKSADSGIVSINLPGFRTSTVLRLTASSVSSKNGVTIAGQTMDGSSDGRLQGVKRLETLNPSSGGFRLSTGAYSAVIVEFSR
jgi:hypothetical protein